jgi:CRISPR/Cas system CSM-associated protein Csm3 (group 7 of RAMP superfamily)
MPEQQDILRIDLSGYWRAGGGRSSGYHLDTLCERDHQGLPYFPGRQLKGILRQAVARAESWGWFDDFDLPPGPCLCWEELLFGSASGTLERDRTWPGTLIIGNAELVSEERAFLAAPEQVELREQLFASLFSTAIDDTGSAQTASLRGMEVALPLSLHAPLTLELTSPDPELQEQQHALLASGLGWQVLAASLHLVDAVGSGRSRGLGEARLTFASTMGDLS